MNICMDCRNIGLICLMNDASPTFESAASFSSASVNAPPPDRVLARPCVLNETLCTGMTMHTERDCGVARRGATRVTGWGGHARNGWVNTRVTGWVEGEGRGELVGQGRGNGLSEIRNGVERCETRAPSLAPTSLASLAPLPPSAPVGPPAALPPIPQRT